MVQKSKVVKVVISMENNFLPKLPDSSEAIKIAEAYSNNRSMEATKELLSDEDKIKMLEVVSANADKFDNDDPAWLIIHAITVLKNAESDILKTTAEAAAKEIMNAKVAAAQTQNEVKQYAASAKKYMEKLIAQKLDSAIQNTVDAINKNVDDIEVKMTEAMTKALVKTAKDESSSRRNVNRHQKWAALAVITSLLIGGGSYYAGTHSYENKYEYQKVLTNNNEWINLVAHWHAATDEERAIYERMVKRVLK